MVSWRLNSKLLVARNRSLNWQSGDNVSGHCKRFFRSDHDIAIGAQTAHSRYVL